jgi:mono/diheme cytochrome c family protein
MQTINGPVYPFEDAPVNTGRVTGTTNFVETNPLPVTGELLQRGHERFDIYCAPCHGRLGDGNGITKKLGVMPAVANLHDQRIVVMTDGEIFNTITHGKSTMAAYGPLMPAQDRWAVIAYLRALQLSQLGSVDDLPPDQQKTLNQ